MYPFYVKDEKIFSFSYRPDKGDLIKYDATGQWFEVTEVANGRGRKVYGRRTIEPNWRYSC